MMFGYSDDWWVILLLPAVLWVPFGPFLMLALGSSCAGKPGRGRRWASVLIPLVPVVTALVPMVFPLEKWERPRLVDGSLGPPEHLYDFLGFFAVYVGGITFGPWLLGYACTHLARFVRARIRARRGGPAEPPEAAHATPEASAP